jgi:hypothetical protein
MPRAAPRPMKTAVARSETGHCKLFSEQIPMPGVPGDTGHENTSSLSERKQRSAWIAKSRPRGGQ